MSDFASRFYAATGIVLGTKDARSVQAFCEGANGEDDRPETYTHEELALWDQLAAASEHDAVDSYRATRGRWLDLLKARREAFAELADREGE